MSESDTDRSGLLSYSAEWHALAHGMFAAFRSYQPLAPAELPDNDDVKAEPHYYKGGWVVGTIIQAALLLFGLRYGLPI